jgi:hypothetical protein
MNQSKILRLSEYSVLSSSLWVFSAALWTIVPLFSPFIEVSDAGGKYFVLSDLGL